MNNKLVDELIIEKLELDTFQFMTNSAFQSGDAIKMSISALTMSFIRWMAKAESVFNISSPPWKAELVINITHWLSIYNKPNK